VGVLDLRPVRRRRFPHLHNREIPLRLLIACPVSA
jgi:hypothetical protein